jgi:hypothetical protein
MRAAADQGPTRTAPVRQPRARRVREPLQDLVALAAVDLQRVARGEGVALGGDVHLTDWPIRGAAGAVRAS